MTKREGRKKAPKITKEIADKVLYLNCKDSKNIRRLEKSLMKLPFFNSEEDLNTDNLENIVLRLERKYGLLLGYISRVDLGDRINYSAMLKENDSSSKWIVSVYGITVWEVFAKLIFYIVYYVQNEKN